MLVVLPVKVKGHFIAWLLGKSNHKLKQTVIDNLILFFVVHLDVANDLQWNFIPNVIDKTLSLVSPINVKILTLLK